MADTILIVDDERSILTTLSGVLMDEGYETWVAENGPQALDMVRDGTPSLVLLDIWMPGMDGIEVLERMRAVVPDLLVLIMSGHGSIETAVKAIKLGAYDYIEKPLSLEKTLLLIQHALGHRKLEEENLRLRKKVERRHILVGQSPAMRRVLETLRAAAPAASRVLITGENGTGKELIARTLHIESPRAEEPFVEVNCAALPEGLIESELFGYERGAFTGAQALHRGKFESAHHGTLFLDEIGDMAPGTQAKVLRVIEEQRFTRLGGNKPIEVDVRIVAATNKDLPEMIARGLFREDLYYRLNVVPIPIPPLRERREDLPILVEHFLKDIAEELGAPPKRLQAGVVEKLMEHAWPGNIRELRNLIERLIILVPSPVIRSSDLPPEFVSAAKAGASSPEEIVYPSLRDARDAFEKRTIERELARHGWNISRTAETLKVERSHLHRKMKALGIDAEKSDSP